MELYGSRLTADCLLSGLRERDFGFPLATASPAHAKLDEATMAEILRNSRLLSLTERELLLRKTNSFVAGALRLAFRALPFVRHNYVAKINTAAERSPCVIGYCQGE
jgi:hypothetical protein